MDENLIYKNHSLFLDEISFKEIYEEFGSPCYIYSQKTILNNLKRYQDSLKNRGLLCFSVKANNNTNILKLISDQGVGFDVVSGGELAKVLYAGAKPDKIIFSGVGKSDEELIMAMRNGIKSINIESISELNRIKLLSKDSEFNPNISLRLNPDVKIDTHPFLETGLKENKFGINQDEVEECAKIIRNNKSLNLVGLAFHIGSGIENFEQLKPALDITKKVYKSLSNFFDLKIVDIGGGLSHEESISEDLIKVVIENVLDEIPKTSQLIVESGKSVISKAGFLLTRVQYVKKRKKNIVVVDAAMNDMIRVALYGAKHEIINISHSKKINKTSTIVGPICESSDTFDDNSSIKADEGDILVISDVGAYGFSMSSNYNSRLRPPEVLVSNGEARLIRKRESIEMLINNEKNV